jgi:DNA-binding LacI/PurR family transcriptional regulator
MTWVKLLTLQGSMKRLASPVVPTVFFVFKVFILSCLYCYFLLMKARLKDVAARAGVAVNTASTILNHRPNSWASKATEERVFKAAKDLNYRPSRAAVGLRLGSFRTIGLVLEDIHNPFYTTCTDLLEERMREYGYDLIIENTRNDPAIKKRCMDSILDRQIDALVYFMDSDEMHKQYMRKAEAMGLHVVAMAAHSDEERPFDVVEIDFQSGLRAAVEHLIGLGHRRFAFLTAIAKDHDPGERPKFFRDLLKAHKLPDDAIHMIPSEHDLQSVLGTFGHFLDTLKTPRPTALIAMNDVAAIAAMRASHERGIKIPEDLSVVGVDNIPIGAFLQPALTTIAQPMKQMADATAEILIQLLENKKEPKNPMRLTFESEFVIRESTGAAPRQ